MVNEFVRRISYLLISVFSCDFMLTHCARLCRWVKALYILSRKKQQAKYLCKNYICSHSRQSSSCSTNAISHVDRYKLCGGIFHKLYFFSKVLIEEKWFTFCLIFKIPVNHTKTTSRTVSMILQIKTAAQISKYN